MIKKNTKDALYPFSIAEKQLLLTINSRVIEYGSSMVEALAAIEDEINNLKKSVTQVVTKSKEKQVRMPKPQNRLNVKCPDCNSIVNISLVNVSKCTAVGGDWKTSMMCNNPKCRFTELSKKSLQDWSKEASK